MEPGIREQLVQDRPPLGSGPVPESLGCLIDRWSGVPVISVPVRIRVQRAAKLEQRGPGERGDRERGPQSAVQGTAIDGVRDAQRQQRDRI